MTEELNRMPCTDKLPTDGETLALVTKALKRSILNGTNQLLGKQIAAVEACLIQQQTLLSNSPEFADKDSIVRHVLIARALCEKVQMELTGARANDVFDEG